MANLELRSFTDIDLADPFFDSLKADYTGFEGWFRRKATGTDKAYVFVDPARHMLDGFLYLKVETGPVTDVSPTLPPAKRLKVGTFKVNAHGTRLGERFMKKVFDHALEEDVDSIYVTVFPKHTGLFDLFKRYGFEKVGEKTTSDGTEWVLGRDLVVRSTDPLKSYPIIRRRSPKALLGIYPEYHTRLFPDSKLITDDINIIQDVSHTNSIHKIYICDMNGVAGLSRGDTILIYRTSDGKGAARFRSVATSICVIEDYRSIQSFSSLDEFLDYTLSYSVFSEEELRKFYADKRPRHVIRFTYNYAFKKRPNRDKLIEICGFSEKSYYGFFKMSQTLFDSALACSTDVPNRLVTS